MLLTEAIRSRIVAGAPLAEIRLLAQAGGMVPLRTAGWAKACAGVTSLAEVLRVTREESST
jgi:type II secretory ATPase GspE/PulE/Tfp pilus assembly ATPase PilB-like protein